jgi:hypothetical protein
MNKIESSPVIIHPIFIIPVLEITEKYNINARNYTLEEFNPQCG